MAPSDRDMPAVLELRARRAYELGRLRAGLRRALPFAACALLVAGTSPTPTWTLGLAGFVAAAAVAAHWRGGVLARASRAGLWAGLPPLMVPVILHLLHHGCAGCAGPSLQLCIALCAGTGLAGGIALGAIVGRERSSDRMRYLAIAALFAAAAGSIGCVFAGAAGLFGMLGGLVAGGAPLLALPRPR